MKNKNEKYLHTISHKRIDPPPVTGKTGVPQLIEKAFLSYNAGRLREACRLFVSKMLADDTTVGLSLSGALTPAKYAVTSATSSGESALAIGDMMALARTPEAKSCSWLAR